MIKYKSDLCMTLCSLYKRAEMLEPERRDWLQYWTWDILLHKSPFLFVCSMCLLSSLHLDARALSLSHWCHFPKSLSLHGLCSPMFPLGVLPLHATSTTNSMIGSWPPHLPTLLTPSHPIIRCSHIIKMWRIWLRISVFSRFYLHTQTSPKRLSYLFSKSSNDSKISI